MESINSDKYTDSMWDNMPVSKIQFSGESNEYVILGKKKYYKNELLSAFGGTLNPGLSPPSKYNFANPVPLGLAAFSFTTFVLSMFNAGAMGVHSPNVVIGAACFYGGVIQLFAGLWDLILGNTFGGTALSSYGGFWLSFAAIYIEDFGIMKAYADEPEQLANAVGFFLLGWAIFTFMLLLCTTKSTVAFFSLFLTLFITFVLLACGEFTGNAKVTKAGGIVGVITSFIGFYNAFVGAATRQNSYVVPKVIPLPH